MWKDFKAFLMRGNVIDLAIAVIIGAAFGAVIQSLVKDIIMPPIGKATGGIDFANLYVSLGGGHPATLAEAQAAGITTINYGVFIDTIIIFVIVALVMFFIVRAMMRMQRKEQPAPAPVTTKKCPECLSDIPIEAKRCAFCTTVLKE